MGLETLTTVRIHLERWTDETMAGNVFHKKYYNLKI
jgi:hypothetical protein